MRLIDLSQPVFDHCPTYPGDPPVRSAVLADHPKTGWRVEQLTLTSHSGSHVDAPLHRVAGGKAIDEMPLRSFVGPAVVADMRNCRPGQPFTSSWLARHLRAELEDRIVLLATGWGGKRQATAEWATGGAFLAPDGASWLIEQQIRGVGIDCNSIGGVREPSNGITHKILLEAGVWVVEDLHFPDEVFSLKEPAEFWGLPVNLKGHSGAFCRPVLAV